MPQERASDRERKQTAIVTGANRGIGLGVATLLIERGWRVIMAVRDDEKGRDAAGKLASTGERTESGTAGTVEVRRVDVADETSVAAFADAIRGERRPIDALVNNAAVALDGFDETVARMTVDTNFYGPIRLTDAVLPLMRKGARVVMVSSGAGELSILSASLRARFTADDLDRDRLYALMEEFVRDVADGRHRDAGWPDSCYGVSKAGLNAFVRIAARDLAERGIAINAVCPGWVRTDMGGPGASRSIDEGAASVVHGVFVDEGTTGGFYRDGSRIAW